MKIKMILTGFRNQEKDRKDCMAAGWAVQSEQRREEGHGGYWEKERFSFGRWCM